MLSEFELIDFKSFDQATLQFGTLEQGAHRFSPLTVLIGANASGKSNLIEGLRLLSLIARGTRLDTIRPGQDASGLRGGLGFRGASKFSFRCRTDFEEYDEYKISLQLRDGNRLHIVEERIDSSSRAVPLFRVAAPSVGVFADIDVAYDSFARGGKKPQVVCTDQMSVLSQLQGSARFHATHKKAQQKVPDFARRYQKLLENVIFLDPRPKEMRSYSFTNETRLAEQGQNLSGVLFNLCRDPDKRERLLEFIRDVPEQDIEDIGFIRTDRGEVMLALQETFGGEARRYDASQLSDGTLRILAVAVAVLSAHENSVVVVEEIDNGVHPSRVEQLLERISQRAKERGLQILITSHNPALLDVLPKAAVPQVVFCYRDPVVGASRLIRLDNIPEYPKLVVQGPLGRLMSSRTLDRFVKQYADQVDRKRNALAWVDSLRQPS